MSTTVNYWDVDGTSLQTLAYNISTLGGDRDSVPPWRGADRVFAYKAGAAARPMVADSRTITLLMWVIGMNADGSVPADQAISYHENRRMLKRLFWKPGGELFALTKRWTDSTGLHSATAMGRVAGNMGVDMFDPRGGKFAVDVFLPDPFFYGPETDTTIPLTTPTVVANDGDDTCTTLAVDFVGVLTNPLITNQTPAPDVWLKVGSSVAAADTVTAVVDETTVIRASDSANLIGAVTHSNSRAWMGLQRGNNTMVLTADGGAGHAVVRHRPAYL